MQKKDLIKFSIHSFNNPQQTRSRREVPYSEKVLDFPGGPVVNSLPASAGGTGSVPGQGRFYTPQGN